MFGYNNLCHTDKCCVCAKSCLDPMQRIDRPDFILADKAILEQRLNYIDEYAFNNSEKMDIRSVLCQMKREERETKEKEKMVSIKTVDVEKEKAKAREEGYKAGLEEAWDIARKLGLNPNDGGYNVAEVNSIFGSRWYDVLLEMSIHEVKEKIAAYEAEQNKHKLGDVVKIYSPLTLGVKTGIYITEDSEAMTLMRRNSENKIVMMVVTKSDANIIEKTGKHFDIQSMLDEIG